ncbi:MAG: solute-binding protein [Proteobacteria bacterium]|nr:solute-binding protein [Pseudomonadota bacterium]
MRRIAAALLVAGTILAACTPGADDRVVVAAGTTVVDSGMIEAIVDEYLATGGDGSIGVIGLSTQQVLAYGDAGNADVTITHDREALDIFLEANTGAVAFPLFSSQFALVGPPDANFPDTSASGVLRDVAAQGLPFVSRDDGSGTYARERTLWAAVDIDPEGADWYIRTGTGMGATLQVASERSAVTLAEIGVFLTARDQLDLKQIGGVQDALENPYDVSVVAPDDAPLASAFVTWLISDAGRSAIESANDSIFGTQVYRIP